MTIAELRALLAKATPGPFRYRPDTSAQRLGMTVENGTVFGTVAMHVSEDDAAAIVALFNDASALLDVVDAAERLQSYLDSDHDNSTQVACDSDYAAEQYARERLRKALARMIPNGNTK